MAMHQLQLQQHQAVRITAVLDRFTDWGSPPVSPFADVVLVWMSTLSEAGHLGSRFVPERVPGAGDKRISSEKRYVNTTSIEGGGDVVALPLQPTVLRVTPTTNYIIPSWRYQTSSFSFFIWARIAKAHTQRNVILADWTAPKCLLFSVSKERRLTLNLRRPVPALYHVKGPGRYGTTGSMAYSDETEPLIDVESTDWAIADDQWAHIGFSYDMVAGVVTLYVNGRAIAHGRVAGATRSLPYHLRPHLCLGFTDSEKPGTKDAACFGHFSDARFYRGVVPLDSLLAG